LHATIYEHAEMFEKPTDGRLWRSLFTDLRFYNEWRSSSSRKLDLTTTTFFCFLPTFHTKRFSRSTHKTSALLTRRAPSAGLSNSLNIPYSIYTGKSFKVLQTNISEIKHFTEKCFRRKLHGGWMKVSRGTWDVVIGLTLDRLKIKITWRSSSIF